MNWYEETASTLEFLRSCLTGVHEDLTRLDHNVGVMITHLDKAIDTLAKGEQKKGGIV